MKKVITILLTLLILLSCASGAIPVSATGYSRFDTEPITHEEKMERLNKLQYLPTKDTIPITEAISYFAVSEQGQIALGFNDSDYASVHVYDTTGNYLYGYRFENHLCSFALFFDGEDLSIIWDQSDYIGSFDQLGNCIQLWKFSNTKNNADEEYKDQWRSAKGRVGELSYHAKRSGILPKYTVFTVEDAEGNKTVIYDAKKEVLISNIFLVAGAFCLAAFVAYGTYHQERQKKKTGDDSLS